MTEERDCCLQQRAPERRSSCSSFVSAIPFAGVPVPSVVPSAASVGVSAALSVDGLVLSAGSAVSSAVPLADGLAVSAFASVVPYFDELAAWAGFGTRWQSAKSAGTTTAIDAEASVFGSRIATDAASPSIPRSTGET